MLKMAKKTLKTMKCEEKKFVDTLFKCNKNYIHYLILSYLIMRIIIYYTMIKIA